MIIGEYRKTKTDRICPKCNKPVYAFERTITSDNGNFDMIDGYFSCSCGWMNESFA